MNTLPALNRRGHVLLHFGTFLLIERCGARKAFPRILSYIRRNSYVPDCTHLRPLKKNVLIARPLGFPDKLRRNTIAHDPAYHRRPRLALPFTWHLAGGRRSQSESNISSTRRNQTG